MKKLVNEGNAEELISAKAPGTETFFELQFSLFSLGLVSFLGSPVWKPRHNGRGRHPDQPLVSSSGSSREYQPASRRPHSEYGSTSSHDESLQSASKQV